MIRSLWVTGAVLLAAAVQVPAQSREPLYVDAELGTQMTVAQIKRVVVGNTLSWGKADGMSFQYIGKDGMLRGGNDKGKRYAYKWHFRDYDNLFCVNTDNPGAGGCVQLLRSGDKISYRRKDGLVELTASVLSGNPLKL